MIKFALIGHPVSHSLSPLIHNTAFEKSGLDARYEAIDLPPDRFDVVFQEMLRNGEFRGFNVTLPYKTRVLPLLDAIAPEARSIGAINTIDLRDGKATGHNTDVHGFCRSLEPVRNKIAGKKALVIGAGGAARAVVYALAHHFGLPEVNIANRTLSNARRLLDDLVPHLNRTHVNVISLDTLRSSKEFGLIVNATSCGLNESETPWETESWSPDQVAYDLIYKPNPTTFLSRAAKAGATVIGGAEMLLQQAAASFEIWTGRALPLEFVKEKLASKVWI